jgi:predicted HicB family RNase H-like nuclease
MELFSTRATLHFAGRTVNELRKAFRDTIEDYRSWCRAEGAEPEKPYSGTLSLRLGPDLHRRIAIRAARERKSVSALIKSALEKIA